MEKRCVFFEVVTEFSYRYFDCHHNVRPTSVLLNRLLYLYTKLKFSGIFFPKVISILIRIIKRGSPGLLRDHPSSGDLPIARIQPTVLLELSLSLKTQAGPLRKHLLLWFSLPISNTVREERIQATYQ
jgi:hypothetical protein